MANTYTYDAAQVSIMIDGQFMVDYGDGDFISWEKDEDNFDAKTSANGTVGVAISHNQIGTVTYKPMQGSKEVTFLKSLANARKQFAIQIDSGGENPETIRGTKAQVIKTPSGSLSGEISDREFQIKVFDYTDE